MDKNFEKDGVWLGIKNFPVWEDNTKMTSHAGDVYIIENPELESFKDPLVKKILEKDKEQRAQKPLHSLANG